MYAIRELATLVPVERTGVTINMISPGLCNTGLIRNVNWKSWVTIKLTRAILGRSAEMGSRTVLYAVSCNGDTHGKYLSDCAIKE
jgi:NAD(P)-dependent dehydrogenase (short-subunit alcohol dehydrogenase family)